MRLTRSHRRHANTGRPELRQTNLSAHQLQQRATGDMFMNFMDDVDDDAMFMFTKGQVVRMHATLRGPRQRLAAKDNPFLG
jgi:hypothetical protein